MIKYMYFVPKLPHETREHYPVCDMTMAHQCPFLATTAAATLNVSFAAATAAAAATSLPFPPSLFPRR